jgi:ribosomal-protein-alanine N-acetyltransferase
MRLETERLILRPFEDSDATDVFELRKDPEVSYNLLSETRSQDESVSWVARAQDSVANKEVYPVAIVLKENRRLMGMCGLFRVSWEHMHAELIYWLGKEFWGKGYMTEAARRTVQFGFEELGLERISVGCFARNKASARIIEKLGFTPEGVARHAYCKDGEFLDELRFGMIRSDWDHSGR